MHIDTKRRRKYFGRYKKPLVEFPNLIEAQVQEFQVADRDRHRRSFKRIFSH